MRQIVKNEEYLFEIIHDIKAPVLSLNIALQNIERDSFLEEIYKINRHNLNYIENMLSAYSILKGKYCPNFEKVNILKIIKEEINVLKFLINEKNLFFDFILKNKKELIVITDKCIIRQIVLNLLTNAIKYTSKNGKIKISCLQEGKVLNICFSNSYDKNLPKICSSKMGLEIIKRKIKLINGKFKTTIKDKEICFNIFLNTNLCENQD